MRHSDAERRLQIEVGAVRDANEKMAQRMRAAESALAAANARADAIELARVVLLADERREKHRADAAQEALAAARRECDLLRALLSDCGEVIDTHMGPSHELLLNRIDEALAAPASASGEEGNT